jgi:hypothetical protein
MSVCTSVKIVENNAATKITSIRLASPAKGEMMDKTKPTNSKIVTSVLFIDIINGLPSEPIKIDLSSAPYFR